MLKQFLVFIVLSMTSGCMQSEPASKSEKQKSEDSGTDISMDPASAQEDATSPSSTSSGNASNDTADSGDSKIIAMLRGNDVVMEGITDKQCVSIPAQAGLPCAYTKRGFANKPKSYSDVCYIKETRQRLISIKCKGTCSDGQNDTLHNDLASKKSFTVEGNAINFGSRRWFVGKGLCKGNWAAD